MTETYVCKKCGGPTEHDHLIDQAHGIPGTYMAGSERFVCTICKTTTHSTSEDASYFRFKLETVKVTVQQAMRNTGHDPNDPRN